MLFTAKIHRLLNRYAIGRESYTVSLIENNILMFDVIYSVRYRRLLALTVGYQVAFCQPHRTRNSTWLNKVVLFRQTCSPQHAVICIMIATHNFYGDICIDNLMTSLYREKVCVHLALTNYLTPHDVQVGSELLVWIQCTIHCNRIGFLSLLHSYSNHSHDTIKVIVIFIIIRLSKKID